MITKLPLAPEHIGCVTVPTVGATGVVLGAATPLPDGLVQPFTVVVTV